MNAITFINDGVVTFSLFIIHPSPARRSAVIRSDCRFLLTTKLQVKLDHFGNLLFFSIESHLLPPFPSIHPSSFHPLLPHHPHPPLQVTRAAFLPWLPFPD